MSSTKKERIIPSLVMRYISQHLKYLNQQTGAMLTYMLDRDIAVVHIEGTQDQINYADKRLLQVIKKEFRSEFEYDPNLTYTPPPPIDWNSIRDTQEKDDNEKWSKVPLIIKNIYQEHPEVQNFNHKQIEEIRLSMNKISVSMPFTQNMEPKDLAKAVPKPITRFDHAFPKGSPIYEMLNSRFKGPTPIQAQSWPILLSGHDMIGVAQTGTGKTLAFLLPALQHIDAQPQNPPPTGPRVLVLAPTRELALQIVDEVNKVGSAKKCICIYGGDDRRRQLARFSKEYVDIIVATPGRLIDFTKNGQLSLDSVTYLVLDEADRMLDLGFAPQIRLIIADIRPDRQVVLTTATWPNYLQWLAKQHTKDPIQINVGSLNLQTVETVRQEIIVIHPDRKEQFFFKFIEDLNPDERCIIFFGKKSIVDALSSDLALKGIPALALHGGHDQSDREATVSDFKNGVCNLLLATDLVSRGLDFHIEVVFNYDFPKNIEEYVHRIGRTGRAGRSGRSVTLMTRRDATHAEELIRILEQAKQYIPESLTQLKDFHSENAATRYNNRRYYRK